MKIAIGCDHIVTPLKNEIAEWLKSLGHKVIDCGTYNSVKTHYPIYGYEVARQIALNEAEFGIVICGTGVGITNACNKVKGIRCALVRDVATAIDARKTCDANVIGFGGRISGIGLIQECIVAFLAESFDKKNAGIVSSIDYQIKNNNFQSTTLFDKIIKNWEAGKYTDKEKMDKVPLPKSWLKKTKK